MARGAASQNLLYVSDIGTNSVDIYPYPSGKLVGKLTGFGSVAGLCADKSGDVFVVDEAPWTFTRTAVRVQFGS
jgi:hypothetical protein